MKTLVTAALAVAVAVVIAIPRVRAHSFPAVDPLASNPVVVELFTSEGCSSCPPADDVLTKLVTTQPIAGAQVIALGEHVDYWDRLGWRDPFSAAQFSARQSEYASAFRLGSIYTPQIVVDGHEQLVGSDLGAATSAIAASARRTSARVDVSLMARRASDGSLDVTVTAQARDQAARASALGVWLAVTEDNLASKVARGENGGRTLHHTAVVRRLTKLGSMRPDGSEGPLAGSVPLTPDWNPAAVRLVAFVQDPSTHRILGAATLKP
jgi:hypothetical protein